MNALYRIADQWLGWIIAASWQLALTVCVVALIAGMLRGASPRLRDALWMLVVVKAFLPPGLTAPVGIGNLVLAPLSGAIGLADLPGLRPAADDQATRSRPTPTGALARQRGGRQGHAFRFAAWPGAVLLLVVWLVGGVLFWTLIAARYVSLLSALRDASSLEEGPVRVLLEQLALEVSTRQAPELLVTDIAPGPCLLGVFRPRIVLPRRLLDGASEVELRAVLAHELAHWRRRDTWAGWLQTAAQSLFWFHPFVWWANAQLRHERECACDEAVLRLGCLTPDAYGESMLRVLTRLRGRSWAWAGLVGVFERGAKLQNRLEEIMSYKPRLQHSNWMRWTAVVALAAFLLPMSPGHSPVPMALAEKPAEGDAEQAAKTAWPRVVKSSPEKGATDVDPALGEIWITFDRDMQKGMSWTGGPPLFPPVDKNREVRWNGARTCVLPVKFEAGSYYRVGINSSNHQNFRGAKGAAAESSAIYFATRGASEDIKARVQVPVITAIEPKNGAGDVDPATTELRVTFDVPMGEGMSWTGGGERFPKLADGKTAQWSADGLTCTLSVVLQPDHDYELGINSVRHNNFQSKWGVPLEAVAYKFHTGRATANGKSGASPNGS